MRSVALGPAVLIAATLGCSVIAPYPARHQSASLTALGDIDGVCASVDASPYGNGREWIIACIRQDALTGAQLSSELVFNTEDPRADPTTWRVVVTRADAGSVYEATLAPRGGQVGCLYGGCTARTHTLDFLKVSWQAGRYDIRYTSAVDHRSYDLSVTLQ